MSRILAMVALAFVAGGAEAQSREAWIRRCQAQDSELSNSNGYRVCTELYVGELDQRQKELVAEVLGKLGRDAGEAAEASLAREHFLRSQELWRGYAEAHCRTAQVMFGAGNPSGDTIPSCSAGEFEARNKQLSRMLQGEYER